ncbi:Adenosine specific kinase [compost metagenome]
MIELAQRNAQAIGAGHCFIVFLGAGYFPLSVLNSIKLVAEVCRIFCATANPTEVILAETEQGRAVLGVVDGYCARDLEGDDDILAQGPVAPDRLQALSARTDRSQPPPPCRPARAASTRVAPWVLPVNQSTRLTPRVIAT